MRVIKDYARLVLFTTGILVGVQLPGFIDQYAKRISAHYLEAKTNFQGYEATAAKHFDGNVAALLQHYETSQDRVFKDDVKTIRNIYSRIQIFSDELKALEGSIVKRVFHVAFYADKSVLDETFAEYAYTVPLTFDAILCGLVSGLAISLWFDLLLALLFQTGRLLVRKLKGGR